MRKRVWAVSFLASFVNQCCWAETTKPAPERDLLVLSHAIAFQLTPAERALYLAALVDVAADIKHPETLTWIREGLAVTEQTPRDWNRDATQKNILCALSVLNPEEALRLLVNMEPPVAPKDKLPGEDVRASAARTIFARVWSKSRLSGLNELRDAARRIGYTGQYPFSAMAPVIADLAKNKHSDLALEVFSEAVLSFAEGRRTKSEPGEYVEFLTAMRNVVPPVLLKSPVVACLHFLAGHTTPSKDESYFAQATNGNAAATFNSKNSLLFAQLLPVLQEVDPDLAGRLYKERREKEPRNQNIPENASIEGVTVVGSDDPIKVLPARDPALQLRRLDTIKSLGPEDSEKALQLSATLSDPAIRAEALAAVSAKMAQQDSQKATKLANESTSALAVIKDDTGKLRLLVELAQAAYAVGDKPRAESLFTQAFDLGETVYQRDVDLFPQKPAYDTEGFDALNELVLAVAPRDVDLIVSRILQTQNVVLKAYLLLPASRAVRKPIEQPQSRVSSGL